MKLPQLILLTISSNKKQLIHLTVEDFKTHKDTIHAMIMITGNDEVPIQISRGVIIKSNDMSISHVEADTMIINQVASVQSSRVLVVAADHRPCLHDITYTRKSSYRCQ